QLESGSKWPEAVAVLRVGREADDRNRAAMEVVLAGDDLGLSLMDALDAITPLARRLEPGLNRFYTGIDGERTVEFRELGQSLQELRQLVGVHRARGDREPLRLSNQCLHDARVRVTMAHRRI